MTHREQAIAATVDILRDEFSEFGYQDLNYRALAEPIVDSILSLFHIECGKSSILADAPWEEWRLVGPWCPLLEGGSE